MGGASVASGWARSWMWREREPTDCIIALARDRSAIDESIEETETVSHPVVLGVSTLSVAE